MDAGLQLCFCLMILARLILKTRVFVSVCSAAIPCSCGFTTVFEGENLFFRRNRLYLAHFQIQSIQVGSAARKPAGPDLRWRAQQQRIAGFLAAQQQGSVLQQRQLADVHDVASLFIY
jgi:hypothetical protein